MKQNNGNRIILYLLTYLLLIVVLSGAINKTNVPQATGYNRSGWVEGVVVIKFKESLPLVRAMTKTGQMRIDQLLARYQIYNLQSVLPVSDENRLKLSGSTLSRVYYAYFSGDQNPGQMAGLLSQEPDVEYAEPKYRHYIEVIPNDPAYIQYQSSYYDIIKAPQAWDYVQGNMGPVVVAVVDGGTDSNHPDLEANFWINQGEIANNGRDDDNNGFVDDIHGWNFANNSPDPTGLNNTPQNANHGSHVAGIISAVSNNGTGVAGVSWNITLMPINAASKTTDNAIDYGYDGILYAAYNGAQIINCSWGRLGGASVYEQEVTDEVNQLGVQIVAAAGNENSMEREFPASYNHVFSVAATNPDDSKASFSNYGTSIDVSAPGLNLYSTFNNGEYGFMSGTSQATPLASGVIGLVKTQHPAWTSEQAAEQVRVTADEIAVQNGQLGQGRINALRAVTEYGPSIRITKVDFEDSDRNKVIEPGETINVYVGLTDYLQAATNVNLNLSTSDPWLSISVADQVLSSIGTLDDITLASPFTFQVAGDAPRGHVAEFTLTMTSGEYHDRDYFSLVILPTYGTTNAGNVQVTVTNIGRIGFADFNDPTQGIGFKYKNGPNLLCEGAIIAGTGPDRISNAARNMIDRDYDQDFSVSSNGDLKIVSPGYHSDEESYGAFADDSARNPLNIRIDQETYAYMQAGYENFIIFKYRIKNQNQSMLDNFYFGLFFDWDLDGNTYNTNVVSYDAGHRLGYVYDAGGLGPETYVGVAALTAGSISYRAIYNDQNDPANPSWGLYDGFSDQEKWESISGGTAITSAGPADVSHVIALGPYSLSADSNLILGFALLGGEKLATLRVSADSASLVWQRLLQLEVPNPPPVTVDNFYLSPNYPNPFNSGTAMDVHIKYTTPVKVDIYNSRGQLIRSLLNGVKEKGIYKITWDSRDAKGKEVASGLYLCRFKTAGFEQTRKMLLLR
jgi:serine protease